MGVVSGKSINTACVTPSDNETGREAPLVGVYPLDIVGGIILFGYNRSVKPDKSHIRFQEDSSRIRAFQKRDTLLARARVRASSMYSKMCRLSSMGKSRRKSRFSKGAIVVDTNKSSAGEQSASNAARYCCRTVDPAALSDSNSSRDMCAIPEASGAMIGLGDGAGVGGETIGMYIVEALSPPSMIAGGSLTDIAESEGMMSLG